MLSLFIKFAHILWQFLIVADLAVACTGSGVNALTDIEIQVSNQNWIFSNFSVYRSPVRSLYGGYELRNQNLWRHKFNKNNFAVYMETLINFFRNGKK